MTYSARARPFTLGRPVTEWCPGGAWAIFIALNCRKDFPNVTRQNRRCLGGAERVKREHERFRKETGNQFLFKVLLNNKATLCWQNIVLGNVKPLKREACSDVISPLTRVAWPVLVKRAPRSSSYSINVLVAFGRVFGEVDPSPEHSPYVRMPLVEALVNDGVYERWPWGSRIKAFPQVLLIRNMAAIDYFNIPLI